MHALVSLVTFWIGFLGGRLIGFSVDLSVLSGVLCLFGGILVSSIEAMKDARLDKAEQ